MCCGNNGFGGNGCLWIILLIIILCCCCGSGNSWNGNGCGCGSNNNCGCGCGGSPAFSRSGEDRPLLGEHQVHPSVVGLSGHPVLQDAPPA